MKNIILFVIIILAIVQEALVKVDKTGIVRVISNIIDNSLKYGSEGGTIGFELAKEQEFYTVTIWDNGLGIAPDALPFMFGRYFTNHEGSNSSGLGLAVASEIVEQHGGTVSASSIPGSRTAVTFKLPALD